MSKIPSIKGLRPKKSNNRKWYKTRLARLRRRNAKKDPENSGTRNRSDIKGWVD